VAPGPPPAEAVVFPAKGGPVIMSEAGTAGAVRLIRCNLPDNTPSYRSADGVLRDVASNQPYWPVGWDAAPVPTLRNGIDGRNGVDGKNGIDGRNGVDGKNGIDGRNGVDGAKGDPGKNATAKSHKWLWTAIAIVGGGAAGGIYYATRKHDQPTTAAGRPPGAIIGPAF